MEWSGRARALPCMMLGRGWQSEEHSHVQQIQSDRIEARLANMAACLIGMEACVGAHHLSRKLQAYGHDARLMPAKYVRA